MSRRPPSRALVASLLACAIAAASCLDSKDDADLLPPPGYAPPPVRPLQVNPPGAGRLGFGRGFWPLEVGSKGETWRWMGGRGEVRLRNPRARRKLRIVGHIPREFMNEAPTLRISIGVRVLDAFLQTDRPLDKEYWVEPALMGSEPSVLVVIETSRTARAPRDSRDLGASIERLAWDETD
jgi:hypothetical protein